MRIPAQVLRQIAEHAAADYPAECCGLLIGLEGTVSRCQPVRNLRAAERCDRFELDPLGHVQAFESARASGEKIIGCYHSHPDGVARPSSLDRQLAQRFGGPFGYLVVAVQPGQASSVYGGLIASDGEIIPEPLEIEEESRVS
ncbi:MAG: Mov34/MPN/PAD-1 family protein [Anaerolineae bacterium]